MTWFHDLGIGIPFPFIRWQDIADIVLMSFLVYQLYNWFRYTKAFQVLIGLGSLALLYLITRTFGFFMTSWVLQELGTAIFVLIIVIFQAEIRQALYRFSLLRNIFSRQDAVQRIDLVDISNSIFAMAGERTGVLIVFQRSEQIDEYLLHGVLVDSLASGQLISSIFKEGAPLHDGATVIRNGRIHQASAHLPLSVNPDLPHYYGTRHRAAVGLTERCDAVVVVVSEERGEVSLALSGTLRKIDTPEQLAGLLNDLLYSPVRETPKPLLWWKQLHRNFWKKAFTVMLVFLSWLIISTREGEITTVSVPVTFRNLPKNYMLVRSSPDDLEIQVKTRSSLVPTPAEGEIAAEIDLSGVKEGYNIIPVKKQDFKLPSGVVINRLRQNAVSVFVEKSRRKRQ